MISLATHFGVLKRLATFGISVEHDLCTTSNIISRGGYSAFVRAVRPAAPTQGKGLYKSCICRGGSQTAPTNRFVGAVGTVVAPTNRFIGAVWEHQPPLQIDL